MGDVDRSSEGRTFAGRARRVAPRVLLLAVVTATVLVVGHRELADGQRAPSRIRYAEGATQQISLNARSMPPGKTFPLGAVGLSIEADELATRDLSASHQSLVGLMRMLGPGTLRVGGNSLDYSWWSTAHEAAPAWATSIATPAALARLRGLLTATGWRVILGVDLGHFDPTRAASEARGAQSILGSRLLGIEIGNEPNAYGTKLVGLRPMTYGLGRYLQEVASYQAVIRATAPGVRFVGPDLSSQDWLTSVALATGTTLAAVSQHYYPTTYSVPRGICKGTPVPTAAELLSQGTRERENAVLRTLVLAGRAARRETRITETNTTSSCDTDGGPATSPVFASALWSLDWILRAVSAGVVGINFHGYFGRCGPDVFSPICAPSQADESRGEVRPRPEYYGLLAAQRLEGGIFIPLALASRSGLGACTAYATVHPSGAVTVAIDNLSTTQPASFRLKLAGYSTATGERLLAPSVMASSGISLESAAFREHGVERNLLRSEGGFRFAVAPASAIILTVRR